MQISTLYQTHEHPLPPEINKAIQKQIQGAMADNELKILFRADDIGVPSKNFSKMMELFLKYQIPLCLAVVPAWMTEERWKAMAGFREKGKDLFCWHMHGYRHMNHEPLGKKQEFGPTRSPQALYTDLSKGQKRLQTIMGKSLTPIFTPPWNRCSMDAMMILKKIGFMGISRNYGSLPVPPQGLKDIPVHVDLHTRKETSARDGWRNMLTELQTGLTSRTCGIMLHHMCMNDQAFFLLEYLLDLFSGYEQIKKITYTDIISKQLKNI